MPESTSQPGHRRRPRAIARIVALALIAATAAALLGLDRFVTSILQSQLRKAVLTEARIGRVDVSLLRGRAVVEDLVIENPRGFAESTFLEIPRAEASLRLRDLIGPARILERLTLTHPKLTLVVPAAGGPNTGRIFRSRQRSADEPRPAPGQVSLLVRCLDIEGLTLAIVDHSAGERPHRLELHGAHLRALQLTFGGRSVRPEADLRLTGYLGASDWPNRVYARGWTQPLARGTEYSVGAYLGGFDLALIEPYMLPAASTIIGEGPIDVGLQLDHQKELLDGSVTVRTARGETYSLRFRREGQKMIVDKASVLLQAFRLPVLGILNTGTVVQETIQEAAGGAAHLTMDVISEMASTGMDTARASVDVVASAGQGDVVGVARGIGRGLGHLAGGVLGVGRNVAGAAAGLTGQAKDMVEGMAGVAPSSDAGSAAAPRQTVESILARHEAARLALLRARLARAALQQDTAIVSVVRNEIGAVTLVAPAPPGQPAVQAP